MGVKLFDTYTLLHFAVGIVFYYWNVSFVNSFIAHTVFEFAENTPLGMKIINNFTYWPGGKPSADSFTNNVGDTIGFVIGWLLAYIIDHINVLKEF